MVKDNYDSGRNRMGADQLAGNVQQIFYDCEMAVPWIPGTHNQRRTSGMCSAARGVSDAGIPSMCFILLYKLHCLKPSAQQINKLINHGDSPYIRVMGFLFLRYCCDPKKMWDWFENYFEDEEEFHLRGEKSDKHPTTIGHWLRSLLTDLDYHDTMLPRIPVPIMRDYKSKLDALPPARGPPGEDSWGGKGGGGVRDRGQGAGFKGGGSRGGYDDRDRGYGGRGDDRDRGYGGGGGRDDRGYQDLDAPRGGRDDRDDRGRDRDDRRDRDRDRDREYDRRRDDRDRDSRRDERRRDNRRDDRDRDYRRDRSPDRRY